MKEDEDSIRYKETEEGLLLFLKAHAKAKKNGITGILNGRIKISITQAPEKGKANTAILKFLAKVLGLKRTQLQLIAGETSPLKTLRIEGIIFEEIASVLRELADSAKESG